jgi:hypothetical protein
MPAVQALYGADALGSLDDLNMASDSLPAPMLPTSVWAAPQSTPLDAGAEKENAANDARSTATGQLVPWAISGHTAAAEAAAPPPLKSSLKATSTLGMNPITIPIKFAPMPAVHAQQAADTELHKVRARASAGMRRGRARAIAASTDPPRASTDPPRASTDPPRAHSACRLPQGMHGMSQLNGSGIPSYLDQTKSSSAHTSRFPASSGLSSLGSAQRVVAGKARAEKTAQPRESEAGGAPRARCARTRQGLVGALAFPRFGLTMPPTLRSPQPSRRVLLPRVAQVVACPSSRVSQCRRATACVARQASRSHRRSAPSARATEPPRPARTKSRGASDSELGAREGDVRTKGRWT